MSALALAPLPAVGFAWALAQLSANAQAAAFGAGAVLMLLGIYLRWLLPEYRMTAEERTKDGRLSEMAARRRVACLRFSGPTVVILGLALFLAVFLA